MVETVAQFCVSILAASVVGFVVGAVLSHRREGGEY